MAFLAAVHRVAVRIGTRMKAQVDLRRPHDLSADVTPIIQTPAHSSLPSGHAIEAHALAVVIGGLHAHRPGPRSGEIATVIADRIALNRVIAGVHYPIDGIVGEVIGRVVGSAALADLTGTERSGEYRIPVGAAFDTDDAGQGAPQDIFAALGGTFPSDGVHRFTMAPVADGLPILEWLRDEMRVELGEAALQ
jgi:hypothetical protein